VLERLVLSEAHRLVGDLLLLIRNAAWFVQLTK